MPEYQHPGVYVEETSTGARPIEGVSTSVAGFLGPTERGPECVQEITSWRAFQCWYGSYLDPAVSSMAYAVQGFFDNGGQRCFIARITSSAGSRLAQGTLGDLTLRAVGRGAWGNRVYAKVEQATRAGSDPNGCAQERFRILLLYYRTVPAAVLDPRDPENVQRPDYVAPDVFEDYDDFSHLKDAASNVLTTINGGSRLIRVSWGDADPHTLAETAAFATVLDGGADAALTSDDYDGRADPIGGETVEDDGPGRGGGLLGMAAIRSVSLLVVPDHVLLPGLLEKVVHQCEQLRDRFAVLSVPQDFRTDLQAGTGRPSLDTSFGAQYYPWIKIHDPVTRADLLVPPAGHVAGLIARTDLEQGVHKAPANAVLIGATDLQDPVTEDDQATLSPAGINCLRDFRSNGRGIRVWSARTMAGDPEWKYINVRRLFLFVEQSIDRGTQWVAFEPNSEPTWARVVRSITDFLATVWRDGALMGTTPDKAFFVRCDRTTMTQDDIDNGRLICMIGIAPVKPAEFVIIRIGQMTADTPS